MLPVWTQCIGTLITQIANIFEELSMKKILPDQFFLIKFKQTDNKRLLQGKNIKSSFYQFNQRTPRAIFKDG
jgi:hypothetical protein